MTINIKSIKYINIKKMILIQIILCIILPFIFHNNSWVKIILDLNNIAIVILAFRQLSLYPTKNASYNLQKILIILYMAACLISAFINNIKLLNILYACKIHFLGFLFFIFCVEFLDKKYVDLILKKIPFLSHLNFVFILIEYIIFGFKQDFLGGIFGNYLGCNSLLNNFMVIVLIISLALYFNKQISFNNLTMIVFENLVIAALSELKIFFVFLVIIFVMFAIFRKLNFKSLLIIVCSTILLIVGLNLMYRVNPYYMNFFKFDNMIESFNLAYLDNGGLSRGTGIKVIEDNFLKTKEKKILGIGFGGANPTKIGIFSSNFYKTYSKLNYNFFSHTYKFLETGYIGLFLFLSFFLSIIFLKTDNNYKIYYDISKIYSICCLLLAIYNTTLFNPYTIYSTYFILSIPFCTRKKEGKNTNA